jgi:hypothetical protein
MGSLIPFSNQPGKSVQKFQRGLGHQFFPRTSWIDRRAERA